MFVAINPPGQDEGERAEDAQTARAHRDAYEAIVALAAAGDVRAAWRAASDVLGGDLFAERTGRRAAALRDVQRAFLALGLDLARGCADADERLHLALDAAEWFPEDAGAWAALADALHAPGANPGVHELCRAMALRQAVNAAPLDRSYKKRLHACDVPSAFRSGEPAVLVPADICPRDARLSSLVSAVADAAEQLWAASKRETGALLLHPVAIAVPPPSSIPDFDTQSQAGPTLPGETQDSADAPARRRRRLRDPAERAASAADIAARLAVLLPPPSDDARQIFASALASLADLRSSRRLGVSPTGADPVVASLDFPASPCSSPSCADDQALSMALGSPCDAVSDEKPRLGSQTAAVHHTDVISAARAVLERAATVAPSVRLRTAVQRLLSVAEAAGLCETLLEGASPDALLACAEVAAALQRQPDAERLLGRVPVHPHEPAERTARRLWLRHLLTGGALCALRKVLHATKSAPCYAGTLSLPAVDAHAAAADMEARAASVIAGAPATLAWAQADARPLLADGDYARLVASLAARPGVAGEGDQAAVLSAALQVAAGSDALLGCLRPGVLSALDEDGLRTLLPRISAAGASLVARALLGDAVSDISGVFLSMANEPLDECIEGSETKADSKSCSGSSSDADEISGAQQLANADSAAGVTNDTAEAESSGVTTEADALSRLAAERAALLAATVRDHAAARTPDVLRALAACAHAGRAVRYAALRVLAGVRPCISPPDDASCVGVVRRLADESASLSAIEAAECASALLVLAQRIVGANRDGLFDTAKLAAFIDSAVQRVLAVPLDAAVLDSAARIRAALALPWDAQRVSPILRLPARVSASLRGCALRLAIAWRVSLCGSARLSAEDASVVLPGADVLHTWAALECGSARSMAALGLCLDDSLRKTLSSADPAALLKNAEAHTAAATAALNALSHGGCDSDDEAVRACALVTSMAAGILAALAGDRAMPAPHAARLVLSLLRIPVGHSVCDCVAGAQTPLINPSSFDTLAHPLALWHAAQAAEWLAQEHALVFALRMRALAALEGSAHVPHADAWAHRMRCRLFATAASLSDLSAAASIGGWQSPAASPSAPAVSDSVGIVNEEPPASLVSDPAARLKEAKIMALEALGAEDRRKAHSDHLRALAELRDTPDAWARLVPAARPASAALSRGARSARPAPGGPVRAFHVPCDYPGDHIAAADDALRAFADAALSHVAGHVEPLSRPADEWARAVAAAAEGLCLRSASVLRRRSAVVRLLAVLEALDPAGALLDAIAATVFHTRF